MNMTFSSKVTNRKISFLGNNEEKEKLIEFEWDGFKLESMRYLEKT